MKEKQILNVLPGTVRRSDTQKSIAQRGGRADLRQKFFRKVLEMA